MKSIFSYLLLLLAFTINAQETWKLYDDSEVAIIRITIEPGDLDRIMQVPEYRNLYSHFLEYYLKRFFDLNKFESKLIALKQKITVFAESDSFRTLDYGFTTEDFHNSYSKSYSNQHVKTGIREFVVNKIIFLATQIEWLEAKPMIYSIDFWPKSPAPDDTVFVEAAIFSKHDLVDVSIQYHPGNSTALLEYPMKFQPKPEIKFVEDADRWLGKIPPLGENNFGHFQIKASNSINETRLAPPNKLIKIQSRERKVAHLVINEILAKNDSTNSDEAGEFDDWIEIHNLSDSEIILSGKFITDNPNNPTKWKFPGTDIKIKPGEFLIIWCDDDSGQSAYHTNFKLSAAGEFIGLVAEDGKTFIDSLSFGKQTADISFGRYFDGENHWQYLEPTPGFSNSITFVKNNKIPINFSLDIFPNPFKKFTNIQFSSQNRRNISIKIYNLLGRLVWQKNLDEMDAVPVDIQWNGVSTFGHPVSAGVYLVKIISGGFIQERKIAFLK